LLIGQDPNQFIKSCREPLGNVDAKVQKNHFLCVLLCLIIIMLSDVWSDISILLQPQNSQIWCKGQTQWEKQWPEILRLSDCQTAEQPGQLLEPWSPSHFFPRSLMILMSESKTKTNTYTIFIRSYTHVLVIFPYISYKQQCLGPHKKTPWRYRASVTWRHGSARLEIFQGHYTGKIR
jgi:hypothetical protein